MALTIDLQLNLAGLQTGMAQATRTVQTGAQAMGQSFTAAANASTKANEQWRSSLQTTTGALQGSLQSINRAMTASTAYAQSLRSIETATLSYADAQAKANRQTVEAGTLMTRTSGALRSFSSLLRSTAVQVAAGIGITAGIQGLVQMAKSLIDAGIAMERFTRTLTAALGTAAEAEKAFTFITAESNRLGQSVTAMVPAFVQLAAATRNTVLEGERTRDLFSALAGAGQAVGLSTEATGRAMVGLIQIISQNAIQLDEFRNQFASQIPGAMAATAKAMGMTTETLLRNIQKQKVGVNDLILGVTAGLKELQRTAPDMANSVEAAFARLSNALFQLSADIARSGLLDLLAKIARFASREVLGIGRFFNISTVKDVEELSRLQDKLQGIQKQQADVTAAMADPSKFQQLLALIRTSPEEQLRVLQEEATATVQAIEQVTAKVKEREAVENVAAQERKKLLEDEDKGKKKILAEEEAARQGAQDAAARARANVGLVQERVNQEKIALDQLQALRAQALEQDYTLAVNSTKQTKAAQADVETAFAIRRLDESRQANLEEAKLQEKTAIQIRDARIAASKAAEAAAQAAATDPKATADAQVNASKRSAAAAVEVQTATLAAQNAIQESVKTRTEAEAAYEKGVSAVVRGERAEQIKLTEAQLQRESELRQQSLQGQEAILNAETALVQAQVDGLVLTQEDGLARVQAIERRGLEVSRALLEERFQNELRLLEQRVAANTATEEDIAAIRARHIQDVQALNIQEQTQAQTHRNQLLRGWIDWVRDVQGALGNFLSRWANGETDLIKDGLQSLKRYFFQIIAEMAAKAAVTSIIIPIVMSVLGGAGGGGGGGVGSGLLGGLGKILGLGGAGGTGGTGGGLLDMLGLAGSASQLGSMFGATSPLSSAVSFLTDRLLEAGSTVSTYFGGPALGTGFSGVTVGGAVDVLPILGGAAALGAGIYGALKATNTAAKAAYAASAAAGAAALASTALVAAGVIAASTGWTGIGLIAAGVTAILGTIAEMVIKPAGPSLSVRAGGGLGIGTADGRLRVEGDLASRTTRREGVDREMAQEVQQRLEAGITAAVIGVVDTINAVALDPAALVGPTQEALQKALQRLQPINTANAKKMEKDIAEQLRFANVAIIGGLLEPLNLAFDQLRDRGTASEQLERLPGTVAGLVAVFKTMNEQLAEIATSENTDVKRQLSGVRNQVENFGNRIAGTAGQIAEQIVTGIVETFRVNVDTELAAQITQFSGLMTTSIRALGFLRNTKQTLEQAGLGGEAVGGQIDRLAQATSEMSARVSTEIVSGALDDLSADLDQFLIQPIRVQATTVNALFTDSLAAIKALWDAWHALESAGLDASGVQAQFTKLLTGLIETTFTVIQESFGSGEFSEFLKILVQLPPALVALNPVLQQVQALGQAFASVVGPIGQVIEAQQNELRTTEERIAFTTHTMAGLRQAIADAGTSAEATLPLYAKLAEQIQANAQAQIDAANEVAAKQIEAVQKAADAQLAAVNRTADLLTDAVNIAADAWIDAVNDFADSLIDQVNAMADAQLAAVKAAAEAQTASVNTWADAMTTSIRTFVDGFTKAINEWSQTSLTVAGQLRQVNEILISARSPEEQRQELIRQEGRLAGVVAAGGPMAAPAMSELIDVLNKQLALARQDKDLKTEEETLKKLQVLQTFLRDQLVALTGQSDPVLAQIAVAVESKKALESIQEYERVMLEYVASVQHAQLEFIQIHQLEAEKAIALQRDANIKAIEQQRDAVILSIQLQRDELVRAIHEQRQLTILAIESQRDNTVRAIEDHRDAVVKAIKEDLVYQLSLVQYELQKLFALQYKAITGVDLPPPTPPSRQVVTPGTGRELPPLLRAQGGLVGLASGAYYAQGGMVHAMLEPGESHWTGYTAQQGQALLAVNQAFPRFAHGGMVPGTGSGDKVPMYLPSPSIVVNRNGTNALRGQGFQSGGTVQGGTNTTVHNYHYHFPNLTIRSQSDLEDLKRALTELKRRGMTRE